MAQKILFIGGTGQISLPCVSEAIRAGHEVTVLNRGTNSHFLAAETRLIEADFKDDAGYANAVAGEYDVVCQFIAFGPDHVERDIRLLAGHVGQYIFISSASAYQKPVEQFPITEDVPLANPYWQYSRDKAAAEQVLAAQTRLPFTVVRPSHTIRTKFPTAMGEGDTVLARMLDQRPILVPGDGQALWTITRAQDFAVPFVRLFGQEKALGTAFHLTSDSAFPWDMIYRAIGKVLGVDVELVHVPTDALAKFHPQWREYLLGDKGYSVLFDNTKIKSVVGAFECTTKLDDILAEPFKLWRAAGGANSLLPSSDLNRLIDQIVEMQRRVDPSQ